MKDEIEHEKPSEQAEADPEMPGSEVNSIHDITKAHGAATPTSKSSTGVVLDATREVRLRLYMGQVFMGWLWFIPSFHMSSDSDNTTLTLVRKEIDFPLGMGRSIVDVQIGMEWVRPSENATPAPEGSTDSVGGAGTGGAAAVVDAVTTGNVENAVHAVQGVEGK